jgi:hypothetical protein
MDSKMKKVKLPKKMGILIFPKKTTKISEKYPAEKYSLTNILTAGGAPVGILVKKIKKAKKKLKS